MFGYTGQSAAVFLDMVDSLLSIPRRGANAATRATADLGTQRGPAMNRELNDRNLIERELDPRRGVTLIDSPMPGRPFLPTLAAYRRPVQTNTSIN